MEIANEYAEFILAVSAAIITCILIFNTLLIQKRDRQGRRSKTFDLIFHLDITRPEIFDSTDRLSDPDILAHRKSANHEERAVYQEILRYLNRLEAIAIGVKEGFYDEDILNEYMGGTLVRAYRDTQKLIERIRLDSSNPRIFIHVEAIARRWEEKKGH